MMNSRNQRRYGYLIFCGLLLVFISAVAACSPPQTLPVGPTSIPTLIPATSPPSSFDVIESQPVLLLVESYPAGLPSALDGEGLYDLHCAECHGLDGRGVVPNARDFSDVDYMRGETPASFYSIISEGRADDMPAFGQELTSDERWAVVYYVWQFSTSAEILELGYDVYRHNCITCHGDDGRSMILGALNFSDHRFLANQAPSDLYVSVTQGMESMPAWQARLDQDERWAVIDYLRTFTYTPGLELNLVIPSGEALVNIASERAECTPYLELENPFAWDDVETIAAGQEIYQDYCTTCHGQDGTGNLPGVIDFTNPVTQSRLDENPINYFCAVAQGFQSMPAFDGELIASDIWQLLTFLNTFGD